MATNSNISSNLSQISNQISQFEKTFQRSSGSVRLLAVSKRKPVDMIRAAAACGQISFGENYADEGASKAKELSCLLYTSPSPRDLSTSRMPSSA